MEEKINVVLRAVARVGNEIRAVAKALENQEFQALRVECRTRLSIGRLNPAPAFGVVLKVAINALPHPVGQRLAAGQRQRQGQM